LAIEMLSYYQTDGHWPSCDGKSGRRLG